jgi:hypothetical protein
MCMSMLCSYLSMDLLGSTTTLARINICTSLKLNKKFNPQLTILVKNVSKFESNF